MFLLKKAGTVQLIHYCCQKLQQMMLNIAVHKTVVFIKIGSLHLVILKYLFIFSELYSKLFFIRTSKF